MPKYRFQCKKCEEFWEEWLKMADCEKPEKSPCPHCRAEKGSVMRVYGLPSVKVDSNFKIDAPHRQGGWQDAVQKMVDAPHVKYGDPQAAARLKAKYLS